MKYTIKATDIELSADLRAYVDKKLASLDKFVKRYGEAVEAHIEVARPSRHHKTGPVFHVDMHVHVPGAALYAEAEGKTVLEAMDAVKDEIGHELERKKEKDVDGVKRAGLKAKRALKE